MTKRRGWVVGLTAALAAATAGSTASVATPESGRSEVAIRPVTLSDGTRRYGVTLRIGEAAVEAGLDTGSTGLRVLPGALSAADAHDLGPARRYTFGAGAAFEGARASARVTVGDLSGSATLQRVTTVGCTPEKPGCAAGALPLAQYGVQGDGLPGEGFKAILGVNMATADVDNPFSAIGAARWIVDLPRPGETAGRLVLNPDAQEAAGFVALPLAAQFADRRGGLHDAVDGCLHDVRSGADICGVVLLDTGAPGLRVVTPGPPPAPWPDGEPVELRLGGRRGAPAAVEELVVGSVAHASHLTFERASNITGPIIYAGLSPYFAFSVLYDPGRREIGLKPRPARPGGPSGALPGRP